jgi:ABC-type Mn2+/Zn2+ transport system permease subunit
MTGWWQHSPFVLIPGASAAALLSGALLPPLGLWIVLQRVVFLGVTLAQVAAAGVALGLLLHLPALPLGLLLCAVAVAIFTGGFRGGVGTGGDRALGAAFCVASALALLFISRSPADLDQVDHVLHGNLIFATTADVRLMAVALLGGLGVSVVFLQRILFCAFDGETAAALGLRVQRWLMLLFGVLAVVLTLSMRTTGALLTFALLVLPPLAALQFQRGLRATFLLASGLGLVGALAGLIVAVSADLHLESSIVVTCFLLVPLARAWMASPPLALLLAAALGSAVPLLAPEHVATPGAGHEHGAAADATHFDVHLSAHRLDPPTRVEVSWKLDVHRTDTAPLPPELWLVLTADGSTTAQPLTRDGSAIGPGESFLDGRFEVELPTGVHRLEGQLWTGPPDAGDGLPVDSATVIGCELR